jgi:hypothetical protein
MRIASKKGFKRFQICQKNLWKVGDLEDMVSGEISTIKKLSTLYQDNMKDTLKEFQNFPD